MSSCTYLTLHYHFENCTAVNMSSRLFTFLYKSEALISPKTKWEHYKKIYYFPPFHFYENNRKDCGFALYFLTCYMSGYQGENIKHNHSWKLFQPRSTFWVSNILCSLAAEKKEKGKLSCVLQSCKRRVWCQRLHAALSQSTDEKKHQKENWLNHRVTWVGKNLQIQPST